MLIGSDKQVIASISDDLGKHMKIREWEINPTTIQELTTSLKFLSHVTLGVFRYLFQDEIQVVAPDIPATKEKYDALCPFLDFGGNICCFDQSRNT